MKSSTKLSSVLLSCSIALTGCGSPASQDSKPQIQSSVAAGGAVESASTSNETSSSIADENSKAEIARFDSEPKSPQTKKNKTETAPAVQVAPSTAIDALEIVNLLDLPRFNEKSVLQTGSTYLYYAGSGTLTEGDIHYKKLLESRGWKEIPPLSPPTDQFIDRLFEKRGYYLRATLSVGGERGELAVMLASLGNVDVRSLPKLADADKEEIPSTPVNVTYKSNSSIPDAADELLKQMTESGWQRCIDFHQTPMDVPHYRDLHFRKEACRINVGILKNPQNLTDKTTIFYHAEFLTPFDIPLTDVSQALKLDLNSGLASFEVSNSRKDLVSLLQASSQRFGWKIAQADKFEAGESHLVPIDVKSGAYVVARLVESGGKYSASFESFTSAPKVKQTETDLVGTDAIAKSQAKMPAAKDTSFDDLNAEIDSTIKAEISKALGSINSPADGSKNLAALQAMAEELANNLESNSSAESNESSVEDTKPNPFDVSEDSEAPTAEIRSINKSFGTLKHAGKTYELDHVACYALREFDEPTKCIIFSDSPIDVEMLKRLLLEEGRPIYGKYVSEKSSAIFCFKVTEYYVSIDANIGSLSMGIATDKIQPTLSYYQGKIAGKLVTTDPIDIGDSTIEFTGQLNLPVVQVDWSKRNSPAAMKLVVDSSKDCLIPEGCNNFSSEGSKYSKKIEATIKAQVAAVEAFYAEQLEANGWKEAASASGDFKRYRTTEQEMEYKLSSIDDACKIEMQIRNPAAAKADAMLPPDGKALLVLGNMSDSKVQMTIAGKTYQVPPSEGQNPKEAMKVVVEPGAVKIQVTVDKGTQKYDMKVDATANSTFGVLFDTSFQDVLRLY